MALQQQFGQTVPAAILERLASCRSTYEFEHVRVDPEESPLQVSVLKAALAGLAPCVMDWGEYSLELGEDAFGRLAKMRSRGPLVALPDVPRRPVKRRAAKPGEVRAVRILESVEAAAKDPVAAIDLRQVVARLSPGASRYLELLVEEGAMNDARARKALKMDGEAFAAAVAELEAAVLSRA